MTAPYGQCTIRAKYGYVTGWTATIESCLRATNVAPYIAAHYLDQYVASTKMAVVEITDEPWFANPAEDQVDANGYSQSRRVTQHFGIVYLNVPWPDNIPRPNYTIGTTLKLHTNYASEYMPLKGRSLKPSSGPAPGSDVQETILITQNEYRVEWDRVQDLSQLDFSGYVGYVNQTEFMGCEPETLLCMAAPQEPSFVLDPSNPCAGKPQ